MKKKISVILCMLLAAAMLAGCGTEKFDTSVPYSFQNEEPGQVVTLAPAEEQAPAEVPAEPIAEEAVPDVPAADTAEAVLPLADEEEAAAEEALQEEPAEPAAEEPAVEESAPEEAFEADGIDALPLEPAGDEGVGPAEGPLAGPASDDVLMPYAVGEEDETRLFESPAEEASVLGLDEEPETEILLGKADEAADEDILVADEPFAVDAAEAAEEVWEPAEEDLQFAEEVRAQAFAVAMTYWNSGYGVETAPSDPGFAWDAMGWYAAWLYRTQQLDLVSYDSAEAFMQSLGCAGLPFDPAEMMNYGEPRTLRTRDGLYFDFDWYKNQIDEILGVEAGVSIEPSARQAVDVVVTQHFDGGLEAAKTFTMTFGTNDQAGSEFNWVLRSVTLPEFAPETDPGLTFTWAEVKEANKLENVLAIYPAVRMYSSEYPESGDTWIFQRNGNPALVAEGPGYCSGQYLGCWFDYEPDEDGVARARIGAFDDAAGSWESLNNTLLENFRDASALRLDRIEDDLIWADCLYRGGYRQKIAFDRGTLVIRELMVLSEEGEVLGSNCYDYSAAEPEFAFLDSWDKSLRDVTVTWESFENGEQTLFTETVSIPVDWEYLPYEGRWGEYTVYNNTEYIGEYEYPGDNTDYELFLTTAKG